MSTYSDKIAYLRQLGIVSIEKLAEEIFMSWEDQDPIR